MLKIRSTNAVCFISATTNVEARLKHSGNDFNYYEFDRTALIMDTYIMYREAIHKDLVLEVNLVDFARYFDKYTNMTKNYKY